MVRQIWPMHMLARDSWSELGSWGVSIKFQLSRERTHADAQRRLWQELRLVVEPGGAAALAALLSGAYGPQPDESVAVLVCGANTDPAMVT